MLSDGNDLVREDRDCENNYIVVSNKNYHYVQSSFRKNAIFCFVGLAEKQTNYISQVNINFVITYSFSSPDPSQF